eukprot:5676013-Amphidinium_carterae.1
MTIVRQIRAWLLLQDCNLLKKKCNRSVFHNKMCACALDHCQGVLMQGLQNFKVEMNLSDTLLVTITVR